MASEQIWRRLTGPDGPSPVFERHDGLRVHLGGLIRWADGTYWSANRFCDTDDLLWKRARALEPKPRRALLLFADLKNPVRDLHTQRTNPDS